ncbi:MAG: GntR family transcriptional regulator [Hyphomicrobiales bacterium]
MKHFYSNIETTSPQDNLALQVIELLCNSPLNKGDRVIETKIADNLQISRTPVRKVLALLAQNGVLAPRAKGGFILAVNKSELSQIQTEQTSDGDDKLFLDIARDRNKGSLPKEVSESDLMRRYEVSRAVVQRVMNKLQRLAIAERKLGKGWIFQPTIDDSDARRESYEFRIILETGILQHPNFKLSPEWVKSTRDAHEEILQAIWKESMSIQLFEMNAKFHLGLAHASQNRYLVSAVEQQNHLRQFLNYDWIYGHERVVTSCQEHLDILTSLEQGNIEFASALLRQHLKTAQQLIRTLK